MRRHDRALGHGADADRQASAARVDDVVPAGLVERLAVRGERGARLVHHRVRDRAAEVLLQDRLQAEEQRAFVGAAARLDVEERPLGVGRVLQPVAGLVAVGIQDEVVERSHDGSSFTS
jgi:hypothetical protein